MSRPKTEEKRAALGKLRGKACDWHDSVCLWHVIGKKNKTFNMTGFENSTLDSRLEALIGWNLQHVIILRHMKAFASH